MTNLRPNFIELSHSQRSDAVSRRLDADSSRATMPAFARHWPSDCPGPIQQLNCAHDSSADHRRRPGDLGVRHPDQRERRRGRTRCGRERRHPAVARDDGRVVARARRRDARVGAARATTSPSPTSRPSSRRPRRCSTCGRCAPTSRTGSRRRTTGTVRGFEYEIDGDRFLRVGRDRRTRRWSRECCRFRRRAASRWCAARSTASTPSLVAALDAAGETIDLTLALADIFGGEIDFSTELQPGDRFELSVEKQFRDDHQFAGYGPIARRRVHQRRPPRPRDALHAGRRARRATTTSTARSMRDSSSPRR